MKCHSPTRHHNYPGNIRTSSQRYGNKLKRRKMRTLERERRNGDNQRKYKIPQSHTPSPNPGNRSTNMKTDSRRKMTIEMGKWGMDVNQTKENMKYQSHTPSSQPREQKHQYENRLERTKMTIEMRKWGMDELNQRKYNIPHPTRHHKPDSVKTGSQWRWEQTIEKKNGDRNGKTRNRDESNQWKYKIPDSTRHHNPDSMKASSQWDENRLENKNDDRNGKKNEEWRWIKPKKI